jgi:hypothetical protein
METPREVNPVLPDEQPLECEVESQCDHDCERKRKLKGKADPVGQRYGGSERGDGYDTASNYKTQALGRKPCT